MRPAVIGLVWATAFVVLEAVQFVFFGGLFQRMNAFLFGFLVLGITTLVFVAAAIVRVPGQVRVAFAQPRLLIQVNVTAALAWLAFLGSVQMIEPAVAYTIGAGVMPLTAFALSRIGWPEGEALRNEAEVLGTVVIALALIGLAAVTFAGGSGFARAGGAFLGVGLAVADGVLFTLLLVYCQRLDRAGVGASAVFGLRFPLYVLTAGALAAMTLGPEDVLPWGDTLVAAAVGMCLVVPPLYALQRAVALVSTMTLGAITAAGPFVIFLLQMIEGRVDTSGLTLIGLCVYFAGALLAAYGAVKATLDKPA